MNSYQRYAGDGQTQTFSFAFLDNYLDKSHIHVYREQADGQGGTTTVPVVGWQWQGDFTITGPMLQTDVGDTLVIRRETPHGSLVAFKNGSHLTAETLNRAVRQALMVAVEAWDKDPLVGLEGTVATLANMATELEALAAVAGDIPGAALIAPHLNAIVGGIIPNLLDIQNIGAAILDIEKVALGLSPLWDPMVSMDYGLITEAPGGIGTLAEGYIPTVAQRMDDIETLAGLSQELEELGGMAEALGTLADVDWDSVGASVQSNWDESNSSSPTYIRNKPDLDALSPQADWEEADSNSKAFIKNKPALGGSQVQADWSETDDASPGYINNKPSVPATAAALGALEDITGLITAGSNVNITGSGTANSPYKINSTASGGGGGGGAVDSVNGQTGTVVLDHTDVGAVSSSDSRLSDARDWTATEVTKLQAEDDGDTAAYKWTPKRVWQAAEAAVTAWWAGVTLKWGDIDNKPTYIAAGASKADARNVIGALGTDVIDTSGALGSSDSSVPSQKAVKTYVDAKGGLSDADKDGSSYARKDGAWIKLGGAAAKDVGTSDGTLLEVGAFGIGGTSAENISGLSTVAELRELPSGFYSVDATLPPLLPDIKTFSSILKITRNSGTGLIFGGHSNRLWFNTWGGSPVDLYGHYEIQHSGNAFQIRPVGSSGSAYTFAPEDAGGCRKTNAKDTTIPKKTDVDFLDGTVLMVYNKHASTEAQVKQLDSKLRINGDTGAPRSQVYVPPKTTAVFRWDAGEGEWLASGVTQ